MPNKKNKNNKKKFKYLNDAIGLSSLGIAGLGIYTATKHAPILGFDFIREDKNLDKMFNKIYKDMGGFGKIKTYLTTSTNAYSPGENAVYLNSYDKDIAAHEAAHATSPFKKLLGKGKYEKLYDISRKGYASILSLKAFAPISFLTGLSTGDTEYLLPTAAHALVGTPILLEEGQANLRAVNYIRKSHGLKKALTRTLPKMFTSYSTYLAPASFTLGLGYLGSKINKVISGKKD